MVRAGDTFALAMNTILTLQDVASARTFYARGYWRSDTLYMLPGVSNSGMGGGKDAGALCAS